MATRKSSKGSKASKGSRSSASSRVKKFVYFFGDGKADGNGKMKDDLGGKGAGLAEMTNAGLPVPPGFTIQTDACGTYYATNGAAGKVETEMVTQLRQLEKAAGAELGSRRIRCW